MSERSGIVERSAGTHPGGRVLISPDFHAAANAEPTKKFHRKEWFAIKCIERDSRLARKSCKYKDTF
jgi:hypothetical protein